MPIFQPQYIFNRITDVTPQLIRHTGTQGIILDIDNTLTLHDHPIPADGVTEWLDNIKSLGIKMIILSNNSPERAEPFADSLGLPFIARAKKPGKKGFLSACGALGIAPKNTMVIGDQIFTDIWGGNRIKSVTVLVKPFELESMLFFRFKRRLERPVIKRYHNNIKKTVDNC